eukprot:CAMPEP_0172507510 /NCGR_PEP_ID=MMETSP1066-20121228/204191_1 /TAXON_ID=671091 /ORGANISM="Coscinodiscus wailesii, Strain CCMP2513" /LENGTH=50 /DNA_ID=CAMNT_0013285075 /DNA_START=97 /DNA_END=246 /DNA_ORIENTATION=+
MRPSRLDGANILRFLSRHSGSNATIVTSNRAWVRVTFDTPAVTSRELKVS